MKNVMAAFLFLFLAHSTGMAGIPDMELLGQGDARYLGFIKVYEATLYTKGPLGNNNILAPDTSRCLKLSYSVSLSKSDIILGANTVLSRQHSPAKLGEVQTEIDRLHRAYQGVEKGDRYFLCYDAATLNTTLFLNEQELVSISSAEFGSIYFGIWLGAVEPIDEGLRNKLLAYNKDK